MRDSLNNRKGYRLRDSLLFFERMLCGFKLAVSLYGVLVRLNHLLNHLTTDGTSLLRGEVTVVALLKVYTNFTCSLHLEVLKSGLLFVILSHKN